MNIKKAVVLIDSHEYYFFTCQDDLSKIGEVWARHCLSCCEHSMPDLLLHADQTAQGYFVEFGGIF